MAGNEQNRRDDARAAYKSYSKGSKLSPKEPTAQYTFGTAAYRLAHIVAKEGKPREEKRLSKEAVDTFRRTTKMQPKHAGAWNGLTKLHIKAGRFQEALKCAEKGEREMIRVAVPPCDTANMTSSFKRVVYVR